MGIHKLTNKRIGLHLARWRRRSKYTQQILAGVLNLYRESITEVEAGRRKLTFLEAVTLRDRLGITLHELSTGQNPTPS